VQSGAIVGSSIFYARQIEWTAARELSFAPQPRYTRLRGDGAVPLPV